VNLLLDTHLLLWAAARDDMMSEEADALIKDPENTLWFSAASIWEVTIKRALNRPDFRTDASVLRSGLLSNGYQELAISGRHCVPLAAFPAHHADPFDRMLLAQAISEGMLLVTSDTKLALYEGPIKVV